MNNKTTTICLLLCTAALLLAPSCNQPEAPVPQATNATSNLSPPDPHHLPPATPFLPPGTLENFKWKGFPSLLFQDTFVWVLCPTGCLLLCQDGQVLDAWQERGQGPGGLLFPTSLTLNQEQELAVFDCDKKRLLLFRAQNGRIRFLQERALPASSMHTTAMHYCQGQWLAEGYYLPQGRAPEKNAPPQAPLALLGADLNVQQVLDWPNILPPDVNCPSSYNAFLLEDGVLAGPSIGLKDTFELQYLGPDLKVRATLKIPNPGRYDLTSLRKGHQTGDYFGADAPPQFFLVEILLYEHWGTRSQEHPFFLTHHLLDRQGKLLASWPSKRFLIRGVKGDRDNAYYTYDEDELQIYRHPLP